MLKRHPLIYLTSTVFLLLSMNSKAVWYESSGQAIIQNDNKQQARQQATQEAIKQALLFAGASITSVQRLTNGLLTDDNLEIRSSGEVDNIELIDEVYEGDVLTVSIRADIFPQFLQCRASDYQKSIVSTWYPIKHRQQATVGNLFDFGQHLAAKFQDEFNRNANSSVFEQIEPYYLTLRKGELAAVELAHKTNSQYVLLAEINSLATIQNASSSLAFWQSPSANRDFSISTAIYDGSTGQQVFNKNLELNAPWTFDMHESIDPASSRLWQSEYGRQIRSALQELSQEIDQTLKCLPIYGRIIYVNNEQLSINLGEQNGLRKGDQLRLFQMNQFFDPSGKLQQQYQLHPEAVVVQQVFNTTATVVSLSGAPLVNIQANDFVSRR